MTQIKSRAGVGAAIVSIALAVAACGSSSSPSSNTASASSSATAAAASGGATMVSTAKGSAGTYLTGPSGHAVYLFAKDSHDKSTCTSTCATYWPPLTTKGTPAGGQGVTSADLGTIKRSDGSLQVTYNGHPLYYFTGDTSSGQTNGQGRLAFGAKWWLVSPSGSAITGSGSSSSSSSTARGY